MHILLADDSQPIQKVVKIALATLQCEFTYVSNFADAEKALQKKQAQIFILDAGLAGAANVQDLKKLEDLAGIPTIVLLGSYEKYAEQDLLGMGIVNILKKPFDGTQLLAIVKKLANTMSPSPPIETFVQSIPELVLVPPAPMPRITQIQFSDESKIGTPLSPIASQFSPPDFRVNIEQKNDFNRESLIQELRGSMETLVKEYCEKNFKGIAREILTSELRRLAEEKARHLVD